MDFDDLIKINEVGRGSELDHANERPFSHNDFEELDRLAQEFGTHHTQIMFPGLSTELIPEAHENVGIAKSALDILTERHSSTMDSINDEGDESVT